MGALVDTLYLRCSWRGVWPPRRQPSHGPTYRSPASLHRMADDGGELEFPYTALHGADHTRPALAQQRWTVAAVTSQYVRSALFPSIASMPVGTVVLMFGGAAEIVAMQPSCPAFPRATRLTIRSAGGGDDLTVLVPNNFSPVVLSCPTT